MRKISANTFGVISASLVLMSAAFLVQACGGGNNTSPFQQVPTSCVGMNCPGAVPVAQSINAMMDSQLTTNKQLEYNEYCSVPNLKATHIVLNGVNVCHFVMKGPAINTQSVGLNGILTPSSNAGGLDTGIHLLAGDTLSLSVQGHYSHRQPRGFGMFVTPNGIRNGCDNEFNVDGNMVDDDGDDLAVINNEANGQPAGLFLALSTNGTSFVSPPTQVADGKRTVIAKTAEDVFVGFNTDQIECGNVDVHYTIDRCLDSSLNSYPCPKE